MRTVLGRSLCSTLLRTRGELGVPFRRGRQQAQAMPPTDGPTQVTKTNLTRLDSWSPVVIRSRQKETSFSDA